jgi:hypothetical protein
MIFCDAVVHCVNFLLISKSAISLDLVVTSIYLSQVLSLYKVDAFTAKCVVVLMNLTTDGFWIGGRIY